MLFFSSFVSNQENTLTIDKVINDNTKHDQKIFLKIDIEGHEYRIIEELNKFENKITGMIIEFHDIDLMYLSFLKNIEKIKEKFYITHIHANNYSYYSKELDNLTTFEVTFINKNIENDSLKSQPDGQYYLNGLDFSCDPEKLDHILIFKQ